MKNIKTSILLLIFCLFGAVFSAGLEPGEFYASGPADRKVLALSFDDGPGKFTPDILALLERFKIKATFFMLGGQVHNNPEYAKAVRDGGHELGNHSWDHVNYKSRFKQLEAINSEAALETVKLELIADLLKTKNEIAAITGVSTRLMRMPNGIDRPWVRDVAKETGYTIVNWTFGMDWVKDSYSSIETQYLKAVKPGAILLFHDGGGYRQDTVKLTEAVILHAKEQGYEFVSVGNLLQKK